jgi:hypothetical protein
MGAPQIVDEETAIKLQEIRNKTAMFTGWSGAIAFPLSIIETMFVLMTAKTTGWIYAILFIPFFVVLLFISFPMIIRIVSIGVSFIGEILSGLASAGIWGIVGIALLFFITGAILLEISRPVFAYIFFKPLPEEYCEGQRAPILKLEPETITIPHCGKGWAKLTVMNGNPVICNVSVIEVKKSGDNRLVMVPTPETEPKIIFKGILTRELLLNPGEMGIFNVTVDAGAGLYLPPWCLPGGNYEYEFTAKDLTIEGKTGAKLESKITLTFIVTG